MLNRVGSCCCAAKRGHIKAHVFMGGRDLNGPIDTRLRITIIILKEQCFLRRAKATKKLHAEMAVKVQGAGGGEVVVLCLIPESEAFPFLGTSSSLLVI